MLYAEDVLDNLLLDGGKWETIYELLVSLGEFDFDGPKLEYKMFNCEYSLVFDNNLPKAEEVAQSSLIALLNRLLSIAPKALQAEITRLTV